MRLAHAPYAGLLVLSLSWLHYGCGSSKASQQSAPAAERSSWQQQPLVIDGDDSDWVKPLTYFARKEKFAYSISNDSSNLYILLSTKEAQTQQKILRGGLTVYINTQAEMNDHNAASIGFPTGVGSHRGKGILTAGKPEVYNRVAELDDLKDYSLSGFNKNYDINYYDYGKSNDAGVEVKLNFNSADELIYEAKVPLASVYASNSKTPGLGKTVAVGFYIDGIPPRPGERGGRGGGVSIGGGLGVGSFGGYGSGVGLSIGSGSLGRIGGGKNAKFQQSKTWQLVSLGKRQPKS